MQQNKSENKHSSASISFPAYSAAVFHISRAPFWHIECPVFVEKINESSGCTSDFSSRTPEYKVLFCRTWYTWHWNVPKRFSLTQMSDSHGCLFVSIVINIVVFLWLKNGNGKHIAFIITRKKKAMTSQGTPWNTFFFWVECRVTFRDWISLFSLQYPKRANNFIDKPVPQVVFSVSFLPPAAIKVAALIYLETTKNPHSRNRNPELNKTAGGFD